jgi:hypothetical protein
MMLVGTLVTRTDRRYRMKNINRAHIYSLAVVTVAIAVLIANASLAHGLVDQSNPTSGGASQILSHMPIGQEFTPSTTNLVGVDIYLRGTVEEGSDTLMINIRKGDIFTPILTSTSRFVEGCPFSIQPNHCIVHFDFPNPITVTPGEKYVIEVQATTTVHGWQADIMDPYPGGAAVIQGAVNLDMDFGFQTYYQDLKDIKIDIKPKSEVNSINCKNLNGVIPVAILTTESFDALSVDHTTVNFEGAVPAHVDKHTGEPKRQVGDIDGDDDPDLVFHFRFGDTALTCESAQATLVGFTFEGLAIRGTDSVRMVPSK